MAAWEWVIVALLAFGALQLLALRYALKGESAEIDATTPAPYAVDAEHGDLAGGESCDRQCPQCGTENRSGFTYCRRCVSFLGR